MNTQFFCTISIVTYQFDSSLLTQTLDSLAHAAQKTDARFQLYLIDNGDELQRLKTTSEAALGQRLLDRHYISGHGNIGYGRGHNLAITQVHSDAHLVLNPDVIVEPDALKIGLTYLSAHPEVSLVTPAAYDQHGKLLHLCKRYPTVFDLGVRGFAPQRLKNLFDARLAHYEMRDLPSDTSTTGIPLASGCFMLARTAHLKQIGGFCSRYFLYMEDFDLSLRIAKLGTITYLPTMRIIHHGGFAARKGLRHIVMFIKSAVLFFNTHGWRLCSLKSTLPSHK